VRRHRHVRRFVERAARTAAGRARLGWDIATTVELDVQTKEEHRLSAPHDPAASSGTDGSNPAPSSAESGANHLGKKRCTPRRLGVAFKPHCRQRQLFHPPTLRTNPPHPPLYHDHCSWLLQRLPRRVRSPKNFCKSDDIISSVIHNIRRPHIAMPARSDD
jgi:hypothetical protein